MGAFATKQTPSIWNIKRFSSVQSLSHDQLFATPWITARQASLSITNSWSSLKLMSIESVMPSSHLILCRPLLLLPSIPPSIRVFSNESALRMRWSKYWSFSFSISPSSTVCQLKKIQASQVNEFSIFLYMGQCKTLHSLEIIPLMSTVTIWDQYLIFLHSELP